MEPAAFLGLFHRADHPFDFYLLFRPFRGLYQSEFEGRAFSQRHFLVFGPGGRDRLRRRQLAPQLPLEARIPMGLQRFGLDESEFDGMLRRSALDY